VNKLNKYYYLVPLTLVSCSVAADTHSFRHEIEVFFSSGVGSIAFVLLLFLILLWLMLPLAVFGLKRRLKDLIRESQETNRMLAEIRDELAVLSADETTGINAEQPGYVDDEKISADLYSEIKFDH
jgi:hypothetical protein